MIIVCTAEEKESLLAQYEYSGCCPPKIRWTIIDEEDEDDSD